MRILSGALLVGAVSLSILTGCSGSDASGEAAANGGLDSKLKEFEGDWKNKESGAKLTISHAGKATLTGWEDERKLTGEIHADNADGVASFDAEGAKDAPFHFLVEFRNGESDRVYLDETNESDVPPLELMKQG